MGNVDMVEVCKARDGTRCRDCIYYETNCKRFRARHPDKKPMDLWSRIYLKEDEDDGSEDNSRL